MRLALACVALFSFERAGAALAAGGGYAVLHDFTGGRLSDASLAPLVAGGADTFYGTASSGGNAGCVRFASTGCGTVFQLTRTAGGRWKETVLHRFRGGRSSWYPIAGVTLGPRGVLYGVTTDTLDGASYDCVPGDYCGTAFQLTPPASGSGEWTATDLFRFNPQTDGVPTFSGLVPDGKGNLYGTTCYLSQSFHGTVFELTPPLSGSGWWMKTVVSDFPNGGNCPSGNVVFDRKGNLYGTTFYGGASDLGLVYMLTPPAKGSGQWTETVLYEFGLNTCYPQTNPMLDANGNLYGTARGCPQLAGGVFELSPPGQPSAPWTETLLTSFLGQNGDSPTAGLTFDAAGNIYGTTANGGTHGHGALFQLKPSASGWTETVLHNFSSTTGYVPGAGPIVGADGALYGTTWEGGYRQGPCKIGGCGVVYRFAL